MIMLHHVFISFVSTTILMAAMQAALFFRMNEFRYDRKRMAYVSAIFLSLCTIIYTLGTIYMGKGSRNMVWTFLSLTLPALVFYFITSRYRDARFFTTFGIANASIALADLFAFLIALRFFRDKAGFTWCFRFLCMGFSYTGMMLWTGGRYRQALGLLNHGWILLCLSIALIWFPCVLPPPAEPKNG
jgi:hypothetical protein